MTSSQETAAAFERRLRPLADPARAAPMRAYMKDQFGFLGLPSPVRRTAVKELLVQHPREPDALLGTAEQLWQLPEREFRYTAIDLLRHHHKRLSPAHLPQLQGWLLRDSWWDTVDGLSAVIGRVVLAERPAQEKMDDWVAHPDFWVRRAAMLHQLGWRRETDRERLARYALLLAPEREFFIRKAIGWALRDYARWDPDFVLGFLAAQRDTLSPLSWCEAHKGC